MRFLIVVLCLLFAGSALAVPVDPDSPDGIAAMYYNAVLATDGEIFIIGHPNVWEQWLPDNPLPVQVSEISDWWKEYFRTHDGRFFMFFHMSWYECPFPPVNPTANQPESMGDVKSMYR